MSVNVDHSTDEAGESVSLLNSSGHTVEVNYLPPVTPPGGTSWQVSVFIVINAALGAGLLAFPQAYHRTGGVFIALLVQGVMLVFAFLALIILARCADKCNASTYQDVVKGMCGTWGQRLCSSVIALYCFGTCITFLIIIGDQWDKFLFFATHDQLFCKKWYLNRKFLIASTSVVFILPLCFSKRIDFLKHVSTLGVFSIIYISFLVVIKYFTGHVTPGPIKTRPDHWTDIFIVIPTICFGYQCHVSVVPVYSCLKERSLSNFMKTVTFAMIACGLCYSSVAVFGYLTFGGLVKSDILESYEPTSDVIVGVILLAVKIYTTYPILHFCGRSALDSLITDMLHLTPPTAISWELRIRIILTLVWFSLSVALALFIPNIADVIEVLGGLAVSFILIFPGVCWLKLTMKSEAMWRRRRYWACLFGSSAFIVIGAFIFGVTTSNAVIDDLNGANDSANKSIPCMS